MFLILFLLIVKHYIADFMLQSEYQVREKGIYGATGGLEHAATHGILTCLALVFVLEFIMSAITLAVLDTIVHYHIDYIKARWGTKDANLQRFWRELGLDQMCHYLFYVWLVWILHDVI
jgi:hypothetical protein